MDRLVRILIVVVIGCMSVSCVDPFKFDTSLEDRAVIIEGVFTDVSAQEYFLEFNDMRYFEIKLNWASVVTNTRDEFITGAEVELASDLNEFWDYTEVEPGIYKLIYPELKALPGVQYGLIVTLTDSTVFSSAFESLPADSQVGKVSFTENTEPQYVFEAGETVIDVVEGVKVNIEMPEASGSETNYYRWDFLTTWILEAALIPASSPFGLCWITEQYNLDEFRLLEVKDKVATENLFFLPTTGNLEVENGFSVRIRQLAISSGYHQFWEDLQNQQDQSDLFAPPPYNLPTNLTATADHVDVYGYFGVGKETNYIWYLNLRELSYVPTFSAPCFPVVPGDDIAPYCSNCLRYEGLKFGAEITNIQPNWWRP